MARGKTLFFLLAILASFNFMTAQEVSGQDDTDLTPTESSPLNQKSQIPFFGSLPNFPHFGSSSGSSSFPGMDFLQLFSSFFGSSSTNSSDENVARRKRSPEDSDDNASGDINENDENNGDGPHSRLFFSLFNTRIVSCNSTTQAGTACISCRQVLNCFSSNVGIVTNCKAFCNNGRCSLYQGPLCSTSSTNSTTPTNSTG